MHSSSKRQISVFSRMRVRVRVMKLTCSLTLDDSTVACRKYFTSIPKIHPRRIQSKSFKRSSIKWLHNDGVILCYIKFKVFILAFNIKLHTISGFGGNRSFNLLGTSRKRSSGSIRIAFNFFCNNLPIVWRPEAGGPRIRIFGTS